MCAKFCANNNNVSASLGVFAMFSYDDPIHAEDIEFTGLTIVYIVNVEGRYAIKAISTGLHEISKDPTTNAEFYCLLNA